MNLGTSVVSVNHVCRTFGSKEVLKDISLQVAEAETFGILGPSGSGKTTLVKLLTGIDEATSGEVRVLGIPMPKLATLQQIGYMAQSDALYTELSAKENLEFFAALYGLKAETAPAGSGMSWSWSICRIICAKESISIPGDETPSVTGNRFIA